MQDNSVHQDVREYLYVKLQLQQPMLGDDEPLQQLN